MAARPSLVAIDSCEPLGGPGIPSGQEKIAGRAGLATYHVIRYRGQVITSFRDSGTEDVFNGKDSRAARRACPVNIWNVARRKLEQLNAVPRLESLRVPPGNQLEPLRGNRVGQHSIRINDQYRLCFRWTELGPADVEITDYH